MTSSSFILPPGVRDISADVLGEDKRLKILPAATWHEFTSLEQMKFCVLNGYYTIPTTELVDRLREIIRGRPAIEIGSGNGVLAEALGIPATDNKQQDRLEIKAVYAAQGQPTINYGPNVIEMDANAAVKHYKPEVVIGCWVTHRYEMRRHERGGNADGVDFGPIFRKTKTFVLVGNRKVHRQHPIWEHRPLVDEASYLISRSGNGTKDFIAVLNRGKK